MYSSVCCAVFFTISAAECYIISIRAFDEDQYVIFWHYLNLIILLRISNTLDISHGNIDLSKLKLCSLVSGGYRHR